MTRVEGWKEEQESIKAFRESLIKLQESISKVTETVQSDLFSLAKEIKLPGTSAGERLKAMAPQVSGRMPVTPENIALVDEYRGLILENLSEQLVLQYRGHKVHYRMMRSWIGLFSCCNS